MALAQIAGRAGGAGRAGAILCVLCAAHCGTASSTAPSTSTSTPTAGTRVQMDLPMAPGDSRNVAYAIWPYGAHGGSHAIDGHPGFDFEFAPGGRALSAVDGIVDNNIDDTQTPGRRTVQLRTPCAGGNCFIAYTNLEQVPANIVAGAPVTRGQVLGVAGAFGTGAAQFAMIHFQIADPAALDPVTNTVIASPETYFTAAARAQIDAIWRSAIYVGEWCEPFLTNSRANQFPLSRTWTRSSGDGPSQIAVRCTAAPDGFSYTLINADGSTEAGTLSLGWAERPIPSVTFTSSAGVTRRGLYDIVGGAMQLALAPPGAARPASLSGALIYASQ